MSHKDRDWKDPRTWNRIKPKDNGRFWISPSCGPGTISHVGICVFCGKLAIVCAALATEEARKGNGHFAQDGVCGGCGLWCPECGLFWAENACGDEAPELYNRDGHLTTFKVTGQLDLGDGCKQDSGFLISCGGCGKKFGTWKLAS